MTSRGYTNSYNRKVNSSSTTSSIQFDKLCQDNGNRPSVAKSAGTVGKWGTTSFTSIRSTNINDSADVRGNKAAKRMKLENKKQNLLQKNSPSHSKNEEIKTDINKPKKFFKSRSTLSSNEHINVLEVSSVPSLQLKSLNEDNKQSSELCTAKKIFDNNVELNESIEGSCRDEGKPPIVLRICKGTARLVCSEESDSESYHTSTHLPDSKISSDRKILSQNPKLECQTSHITSCKSPTSTIAHSVNASEMRTTRSRAKSLRPDVTLSKETPVSKNSNSGLSLTLRKSTIDSNNSFVSRYDIVKTDSISKPSNKTSESSKDNNQSLPSATQELIDILPNDVESLRSETKQENFDITKGNSNYSSKKCTNLNSTRTSGSDNLDIISSPIPSTCKENTVQIEQHIKDEQFCKINSLVINRTSKDISNVDQDWFSSSDDSECANNNLQAEHQSDSQCIISDTDLLASTTNKMDEKPVVTKKGSIFKTRSTGKTDGNKRRALYKHKWCDNDKELKSSSVDNDGMNAPSTSCTTKFHTTTVTFEEELENPFLTRVVTYPEAGIDLSDDLENSVTSIRCGKKVKEFYTVVKNVKKAHQIQESGEFQEFNDDVEYILDTLTENNPNATRCLSAIRLASKCMAPAFRMHVRADGTVAKFFKALHDATTDQSLALCTATVMFVLSQDRLAMDLDRDCLELMLNLLESDASYKNALDDCGLSGVELQKNKEKVRQLCADIQAQGHAKHLNLDNITVGQLAMETLLSLTSRRAGEWFKEELRELGGLEHIIKTITECHRNLSVIDDSSSVWTEPVLDKLRKVDRCLRVLENVTHMNEENQVYLLNYSDSILVITLAKFYNFCGQKISKYPTKDTNDKSSNGVVVRECLFAVIKVLINLTYRFNRQSFGDSTVGRQDGIIDNSLHLILVVPQSLPEEKRFDIMMLALILLINLVEQSEDNKQLLITSQTISNTEGQQNGLDALINLFFKQEELARAEEQKTDAILDGKKDSEQPETISSTSKSQEEFIEETVAKLLQKAGRHMEHTLIGAYVVLLLGYLIMDSKNYENLVRSRLPDGTFVTMIAVLQKFFNFMNLTASNETSNCGIAATEKVIKFLTKSDARLTEENNDSQLNTEDTNTINSTF